MKVEIDMPCTQGKIQSIFITFTFFIVVKGRMKDEVVGTVVCAVNQYLELENDDVRM